MTEWGVITVLIALIGLGVTVAKPVISLTRSITTLSTLVNELAKDMAELTNKNSDSHGRLWKHNAEQDARIDNHETRIAVVEERTK